MKKCLKRMLSMLVAFLLVASLGGATASAEDDSDTIVNYTVDASNKTITVSAASGTDYTENTGIQDAINYINEQEEKTGWTITVNEGTYYRFTVLSGLDDLTVQAADGAEVKIIVLNDDEAPVTASGGFPDTMGVSVREADGVTIDGLIFISKDGTKCVYDYAAAAVSNFTESLNKGDNLTVTNCTFYGSSTFFGVFFGDSTTWEVSNCVFYDQNYAIVYYADNSDVNSVKIDSNTFYNCVRAVDGYFGSGSSVNENFGSYYFTNNTVIGSEDLNCKILISDDCGGTDYNGTGAVTISGNTLSNASFLLFDINVTNDVLSDNTFGDNSYINVSSEVTSTVNLTVVCDSDEDHKGYWELSSENPINIGGGDYSLTKEEIVIIKEAIEKANATGSHTLTLDFSSLYSSDATNYWKVVTYLKYGVYWVGTSNDTEDPTIDKTVDVTKASSGDTVTFSLIATLPDYLYIYDGEGGADGATERGSYIITFHDVMDSVFTSNDDIVVTIGDTVISSNYYTITSVTDDGCTFELTMDLIALYDAELITDEQIDACEEIIVTYSATVADGTAAGSYDNAVYLEYEYWTTDEVTVTVTVPEPEEDSDTPDTTTTVDNPTTGGPDMLLWLAAAAAAAVILAGTYRKKANR